jgi:putative membrane protein
MSENSPKRTLQALILAVLGLFLLGKLWDGTVLLYISQRFIILVLLAGLGLVVLAQSIIRENAARREEIKHLEGETYGSGDDPDEVDRPSDWGLWLVALPVLLGVLIPARPLGAAAAANRAFNTNVPFTTTYGSVKIQAEERSVLDWLRVAHDTPDLQTLVGQPVQVSGFVYRDIRLKENQFLVGRFAITCCVADAFAVGMTVNDAHAASFADNQWVRVTGRLGVEEQGGKSFPVIQAESVTPEPEPQQPYLFP